MQVHVDRSGERYGPYSIEEVNAYLANGTLLPTDQAWQDGMPNWVPINQIPGVVMHGGTATQSSPTALFAGKSSKKESLIGIGVCVVLFSLGAGIWFLFFFEGEAKQLGTEAKEPDRPKVHLTIESKKIIPPQVEPKPFFDLDDKNHVVIETAIRRELHKPAGKLTEADLTQIEKLDLTDGQLTDISLLALLKRLKHLSLYDNQLTWTDIDRLQKALPACTISHNTTMSAEESTLFIEEAIGRNAEPNTMTGFDLEFENLTDASALRKLEQIEILFLAGNKFTNANGLAELKRLHYLGLGGNQLTDISDLRGLTELAELDLSANKLSDVSPLAGLKELFALKLDANQLTDISALAKLTQLTSLDLSGNKLSNVNALVGLKKLSALKLDANQLTDISALVGLSQLQSLSLNGNQITDEQLVNLKGLSNLKFLSLQETFIRLSLRDNPALTKAKVDILQKALPNCKIQHAAKLSAEASAVIINRAIRNKLKKPEGELTEKDLLQVISLSQLQLAGKQLTDVSALVKLTQLTSLDLSGNKLSNINALAKLKGLAYLNLSRNPLTWADINFLQNVLPRCSIEHDIYLSVTESAEFIEARVRKKINKREGKLTWADLENVKELNLFDSHLTDINALAWLKQLVRLDLSNDFDTDPSKLPTDFSALTGLSQLTTLNLSVNAFDDKQLKHLANLKKLKTLNLSETLITDIKTLAGLKQLEHLYINDNEIKAGQLKHLAELTQLKVLTIHNNPKITESEIATLQKALPECEIESIRDGF